MPAKMAALAPSETKARFIEHLNLNQPSRQHLYPMMKAEAAVAWQRLQSGRDALLQSLVYSNVQPPYSNNQICETAMHREILRVYCSASTETRACYDLAHDLGGVEAENWIIRWCLWHVFRDRDQRKKSRTSAQRAEHKAELEKVTRQFRDDILKGLQGHSPQLVVAPPLNHQKPFRKPYDPIRDC